MILILTQLSDLHSERVADALKKRGHQYAVLATDSFTTSAACSLTFDQRSFGNYLSLDGTPLDLNSITTVWNRRPATSISKPYSPTHDQRFVEEETSHYLGSLWQILKNRFWINDVSRQREANYKPYQLKLAREVGLLIPPTLITNQPQSARAFFEEHNQRIIYKTMAGHVRDCVDRGYGIYTNLIDPQDFNRRLESIACCPCMFQAYIDKHVELRITVIGNHICSAEIDSQSIDNARVDWRRVVDDIPLPQRSCSIPEQVKQGIARFMKELGLVFGCIDMIITPRGDYYFLEINPAGQWLWLDEVTDLHLIDRFVDLLGTHE